MRSLLTGFSKRSCARPRSAGSLWRILGVGLLLAHAAAAQAPADPPASGHFDFDHSPDAVVLRFTESPGELAAAEGRKQLTLYGDGRMVIERPRAMRFGGVRQVHLDDSRVRKILGMLHQRGVTRFDAAEMREEIRERARTRKSEGAAVELYEVSDAETVSLEIVVSEQGGPTRRSVVQWRGLRADRRRHPEASALEDLAAACDELRLLMRETAADR